MATTKTQTLDELFTEIAKKHLRIETLEVRGRDHLDFQDCSVIGIRRALEAAFRAGQDRQQINDAQAWKDMQEKVRPGVKERLMENLMKKFDSGSKTSTPE